MSQPEDEDPAALFRAAIGAVTPIEATPPANPKPRPKPRARMAERDEAEAHGEFQRLLRDASPLEAGDTASYRRDALPPRSFQRLKRGQFSVQDELDLHGATAAQAETLLRQFLLEAHAHEYGCVRIIHGKGRQSDGGAPVLKNLVDRLLRLRNDVLAFHSAPAAQGGTGAMLVLLARR
ncbi:Smr/MutS family protein [Xanthomonas theicola]|uniref:SMR domain protein n=1 Tax=Xanthomonas theicola TaxID=56464 RepID=A0A2S6ZCT0_9XANT|nr:Smr/MutS family protein [Xanthomonas theicola]PPT88476.1 SMR domain protein [Xanthomonas theicola]QNH25267.1 SMR domain protein [Xanthomonas theicola]